MSNLGVQNPVAPTLWCARNACCWASLPLPNYPSPTGDATHSGTLTHHLSQLNTAINCWLRPRCLSGTITSPWGLGCSQVAAAILGHSQGQSPFNEQRHLHQLIKPSVMPDSGLPTKPTPERAMAWGGFAKKWFSPSTIASWSVLKWLLPKWKAFSLMKWVASLFLEFGNWWESLKNPFSY